MPLVRSSLNPPDTPQGNVRWPDTIDEIIAGDHAVALAYVTPASGVVLAPVTNFGMRDREAGTVTVNSSVGAWKKLDRIRRNPHVALAFHTREHARSDRPEYVLVQGKASLTSLSDRGWLDRHREEWERFTGPMREFGPLWGRWLSVYHWRVGIEVAAERVIVWPDLGCSGAPEVHGAPLPSGPPAPQRPPARGTGPRINHARAGKRAARLPNSLLGWVGADGLPVVVPVEVGPAEENGVVLGAQEGLVPPGGRRAGLTAHWFSRHVLGQKQSIHTGWLEADEHGIVYAPHTLAAYFLPPSKLLYKLAVGLFTRLRLRGARRAGLPAG
jgi:pyridoxamine 5'-phosphate oxidase-like protein